MCLRIGLGDIMDSQKPWRNYLFDLQESTPKQTYCGLNAIRVYDKDNFVFDQNNFPITTAATQVLQLQQTKHALASETIEDLPVMESSSQPLRKHLGNGSYEINMIAVGQRRSEMNGIPHNLDVDDIYFGL